MNVVCVICTQQRRPVAGAVEAGITKKLARLNGSDRALLKLAGAVAYVQHEADGGNDDDAEADADRDVSSIVTDYTELWRNCGIHEVLCEASCTLVGTVYANRNVRGDEVAREDGVLTNHTRRFAQLTIEGLAVYGRRETSKLLCDASRTTANAVRASINVRYVK